MIGYRPPSAGKYRRKKLVGQVSKLFWTILCLVGTAFLILFLIKYVIPWLDLLNETV